MSGDGTAAAMTQILKMLADGGVGLTDEAYNALEVETRAALMALFVRSEMPLAFNKASTEHNYPTDDRCLYLGSHQCCDRDVDESDSIYVELWAWIDEEDGSDFVSWNIATVDQERHPISYCPFCGVDLRQLLLNE